MSKQFERDTNGLWMTNSQSKNSQSVVDYLNFKIHESNDRRQNIIYSLVGNETDPDILLETFDRLSHEERCKFYANVDNVEYISNHIKTWVWCEPELYPISGYEEVLNATYDYWIANPSQISDAIKMAWEDGQDQGFYSLMVMNKVFGNEYCKIVWRDFDYLKISPLILGELIYETVDKSSLEPYINKIMNRENTVEQRYLRCVIDKRLSMLG